MDELQLGGRSPWRGLMLGGVLGLSLVAVPHAAATGAGDALTRLKAGNARFVANPREPLPIDEARTSSAKGGQAPVAAVLSCADSTVPPEVVFHAGLGDLFVVRTAGQVADRSTLASLEFAVDRLHVPLVVAMGHDTCDVVKAASAPVTAGSPALDNLLASIRRSTPVSSSRPDAARMRAAILGQVENTLNDMVAGSPLLRTAGESGQVTLIGAYYDAASGRVFFSDPVALANAPVAARPLGEQY
jgi:carbonic anhydrase